YDPRLAQLYQGLQSALAPFAQTYQEVQQGAAWLRDIAYILEPSAPQVSSADQVANQLRDYLDTVRYRSDLAPPLATLRALNADSICDIAVLRSNDAPGNTASTSAITRWIAASDGLPLRLTATSMARSF